MTISLLLFYLFSSIVLFSATMVVFSKNPVHSVLFLILAFFNSAGLFLIAGSEFLAMILVIVYVGAVAVLFLFVVMMLNINFTLLRQGMKRVMPVGLTVGFVFIVELILVAFSYGKDPFFAPASVNPMPEGAVSNTEALGQILYTDYVYLFQSVGLILLVAMIGAIVLTHRQREGVKKQKIATQVRRDKEKTVTLVSVKPGEGA